MNLSECLESNLPSELQEKIGLDWLYQMNLAFKDTEHLNARLIEEMDEVIDLPVAQRQEAFRRWLNSISAQNVQKQEDDSSSADDVYI